MHTLTQDKLTIINIYKFHHILLLITLRASEGTMRNIILIMSVRVLGVGLYGQTG